MSLNTVALLTTLLILLVAALLIAVSLAVWLVMRATVRAHREWHAIWEGHSILLRNTPGSEELIVDGVVVARGGSRLAAEGTLVHHLHVGDRLVVISGLIRQSDRGLRGHVLVDGRWIGGDSL